MIDLSALQKAIKMLDLLCNACDGPVFL